MDPIKPEPTFEESIKQVMQTLPPPIRSYLAEGKYTVVAQSLMAKYALRIDQGGVLEREIMLLLMGIENPEEFNQALVTEANLNQQTIAGIVQDVNTQIFSPLREEMRKGVEAFGKKSPQISSVMPARQPVVAPTAPRPSPKAMEGIARPMGVPPAPAAGTGQSTSHFHLENKLPPRPSAQVPVAAAALRTHVSALPQQPLRPAVASGVGGLKPIPVQPQTASQPAPFPQPPKSMSAEPISTQPKSVNILSIAPLPPKMVLPRAVGAGFRPSITPSSPKPIGSSKLLEDHEEPHIDISNKVQAASSETPLQQALRTVLPRPAEASGVGGSPPPNLPGAVPPPDIMPPSRPAPASKVSQAPVKPYSADPYREPIEP
ncbi:MAG: hypothetical protein NUV90_03190 [Candidatus Parcubacteria bacterium]|nr:hypothetical protein [Candidatus Parcubacteria bacterium]